MCGTVAVLYSGAMYPAAEAERLGLSPEAPVLNLVEKIYQALGGLRREAGRKIGGGG